MPANKKHQPNTFAERVTMNGNCSSFYVPPFEEQFFTAIHCGMLCTYKAIDDQIVRIHRKDKLFTKTLVFLSIPRHSHISLPLRLFFPSSFPYQNFFTVSWNPDDPNNENDCKQYKNFEKTKVSWFCTRYKIESRSDLR